MERLLWKKFVNGFLNLVLGLIAHELFRDFSVLKEKDRRDTLDPVFLGRIRIFIYVHFSDRNTAGVGRCDLFDHRTEHPAGPAPLGPKIDQNRLLGLKHLRLEISVGKSLFSAHGFTPLEIENKLLKYRILFSVKLTRKTDNSVPAILKGQAPLMEDGNDPFVATEP